MASKAEQRRDDLRARLIDIAESRIATDGMAAIKARDLAQGAGCAVGAIYNVFADLQDLVIAVNGRTFGRLGLAVAASIADNADAPPIDRLIVMSRAYLQFATDHPRLWRTLFDLQMSVQSAVPAWYLAEMQRLFGYIAAPLGEIYPDWTPQQIDLMTRTLFSSVHGVVLLGMENRISSVPRGDMEDMIALLLTHVTGASKNS
jgi:AcrR family transcriptional regulator